MIVEFWIGGKRNLASDRHEVQKAIERALNEIESEREVPVGFYAGTIASFHVFNIPAGSEVPRFADNALTVGINRATGYGGMTWWGEKIPEYPDQAHWVTRNRNPPNFDPRVTADPGHPLWYDKRNVVPMKEVASALEDFCFNNGKRPTVVEWEPSTVNGQRLDS
ncbi:Imm1 family immunity protein [Streptomyces sp. NBC_00257]|uniref:Imm1 family immunity protein n=1 Tax=unclassified Streptomyces TaxID=2593676 RepID=UPI0022567845|nr:MULTISPECIES: Imm1 family immunity protein [unclassified Streptomyces]MCX4870845.1 Imm1 family immunity protein [Streptomyces sp. NBC_00906]MCX4901585.1 Imm1 family immunity protein [Streptomyces sp. NBC_00892]MCX5426828.1 Imm1 family immunity protein [Streptomyces sp. NBC_00062]